MSAFKNLKGGDRIRFWLRSGTKLVNGRAVPDFVKRTASVQPMLVFPTHVVVNLGGRFGTPAVVDESNYIGRA